MVNEIKTDKAPAAPGLLSQATEKNGVVITSGQIHLTTDGKLLEGTTTDKTKQVMTNLRHILEAAECTFNDVLKATVYVTDMGKYGEFNETYKTFFEDGSVMPAREVICVKELPLGAELEISMVAIKN